MSAQYPADTQAGSPPAYSQQTTQGQGNGGLFGGYMPQNVEVFDSFFGYVGGVSQTNLTNQTVKPAPFGVDLGASNAPVYAIVGGVAKFVPQVGDPNV